MDAARPFAGGAASYSHGRSARAVFQPVSSCGSCVLDTPGARLREADCLGGWSPADSVDVGLRFLFIQCKPGEGKVQGAA